MKTLIDHVHNLSKYTTDNPDIIIQSLLQCPMVIDDDSLLGYFVEENPWGNSMMIMQVDGDGSKIWKWIQEIAKKNNVKTIYCISQRWKAICRKYGFKPTGVLCEREGFNT